MKPRMLLRAILIGLAIAAWALLMLPRSGDTQVTPRVVAPDELEVAVFAGGCFWCMEGPFDALKGVQSTISGYTGGSKVNPTYEEVSSGETGHTEALQVTFDPRVVSYQKLLEVYWKNVDPLDPQGQFCDKGSQYRSAIFYKGPDQKRLAEASLEHWKSSGRFSEAIATKLEEASTFYPAEDYHQDYYRKNPTRYQFYRYACGRDARLKEVWGEEATDHE